MSAVTVIPADQAPDRSARHRAAFLGALARREALAFARADDVTEQARTLARQGDAVRTAAARWWSA